MFNVETLSCAAEALARLENDTLRNNPIELIMMDWRMPGMDGIEAARKIRRELALTVPIIMMTAYGKEAERAAARQAGISGFLIKPIYPSTLFDAIMNAKRPLVLIVDDNPTIAGRVRNDQDPSPGKKYDAEVVSACLDLFEKENFTLQ